MNSNKSWSEDEKKSLIELKSQGISNTEISSELGRSVSAVRHKLANLKDSINDANYNDLLNNETSESQERSSISIIESILQDLKKGTIKVIELAQKYNTTTQEIEKHIFELSKSRNVSISNGLARIEKPSFGHIDISIFSNDWQKYGLVADTHLACKEERLDALHAIYDIFEKEGIKHVFHAGNIVDGYVQHINNISVITSTPDGQAQYVVDNYPQRKGIVTHFITGDDHEGWWIKDGLNWGAYLEMMAVKQGRNDLHYIGHVEADVDLVTSGGKAVMKIQHPGGGSSYARSYVAQKQVESFQGGEKPHILVQGHYHINNYMLERNVHVINLPGFQDQTIFARKKRLRMEIGGGILHLQQNSKDASITRLKYEIIPFFDRKYYQRYLRSDTNLIKGKLELNNS